METLLTPLLAAHGLTCGYGARPVLREVSLAIRAGEMVGVAGPNGCGKTTLVRALTGLLPAQAGGVQFDGQPLDALDWRQRARRVAVLPQQAERSFPFSVQEFVRMGRYPHAGTEAAAHDDEAVREALQLTDTEQLAARPVSELSGGEAQRVQLAQALAQQPALLILDEPTAHLDISHQTDILDRLRRLNAGGLAVLMILHDLNLVADYCDRVVLLHEGQVYRDGTPAAVLTYATIEAVYRTVVVVGEHPVTKRPHIYPIARRVLEGQPR